MNRSEYRALNPYYKVQTNNLGVDTGHSLPNYKEQNNNLGGYTNTCYKEQNKNFQD